MRALMILLLLGGLFAAVAPWLVATGGLDGPRFPVRLSLRDRLRLAVASRDVGSLFFRRGKSTWWFVTTLAVYTTPTATAVNAGTKLDKAIADLSGFETQLNRISEAWWDSNTDLQTPGPQQLGDASMTFFDDDGVGSDADSVARQAVDTAMVEGVTGFLVNAPKKKGTVAAADKVNVFPVTLGARNTDYTLEQRSARYVCQFAITGTPAKLVAVT